MKKTPSLLELIIAILIIVIVNIFSYLYQPLISNNDGKGMDGVEYYKVAEDLAKNISPQAKAPFVYRVGTPFLVSQLYPSDLLLGFKYINIIAGSLIPIALLFWIAIFYEGFFVRILPVILFSLTWHSPLRLSWYYPVHSDPVSILILLILLILLYYLDRDSIGNENNTNNRNNSKILFISFIFLTLIGVFFREICILPAFIYSIKSINIDIFKLKSVKLAKLKEINIYYLIPFIFGIIGIFITHLLVVKTNSYSFLGAVGLWLYQKSIIMNFHALLLAFGTIIFIIFLTYRDTISYLKSNRNHLYYLLIILFLSYAGGSDTERIIYWSFPIVYLLLANSIIKNKDNLKNISLIILISLGQFVNMRVFWATPDYPNSYESVLPILTPMTSNFPFLDLFTIHGNWKVNVLSFAEYMLLFILCYIFYNFRNFINKK